MSAFKKILKFSLIGVLLVLPFVIYLNLQNISDWWRLSNYQPSAQISSIANDTTMTDYGKKLFYVNQPQLLDKATFRQNCTNAEQSIVLGCYIEGQGIYIFNVTDERLDGVHEVTSAHEMLHSAYDRLSDEERAKVDSMIADNFARVKNQRVLDTVEQYRSKDPSVVPNELHSILGTEVRELTPDLEQYYKKYFLNRLAVVEISEKYEKVFTERENQIKSYDERLKTLKKQIDDQQTSLETQSKQLAERRAVLESLLNSNKTDEYNAAVPGFNAFVASYNNGVKQVKVLIGEYNTIVAQRNSIASEEQELINAIDTRLSPQATE